MITNPPEAPTIRDYHHQREVDHYNRARGTCLGAGCCPECGRPLGDVLQRDGTYKRRCFCDGYAPGSL